MCTAKSSITDKCLHSEVRYICEFRMVQADYFYKEH
jgi:hypothetical protein